MDAERIINGKIFDVWKKDYPLLFNETNPHLSLKNNQKRIIENEIRFLVLSFTSDWLFPTKESREIVSLLNSIGSNVSFAEVVSDRGHDSFLLDEPQFFRVCEGFLRGIK